MNKFWIGCCSELLTYGRPWVPMFHDGDRKQGTINTSAVSSTNSTGDGPAEPPVALNNPDFHHPQKPIGFMQALRIPVSRPVCQFCVHLRLVFPIKVLEFLTFFFTSMKWLFVAISLRNWSVLLAWCSCIRYAVKPTFRKSARRSLLLWNTRKLWNGITFKFRKMSLNSWTI